MPSLALDVPLVYDGATKRALARGLAATYAEIMEAPLPTVTVTIHDLGAGGVWRFGEDGDPEPGALLMCDVRRGRAVATRAALCRALVDVCAELGNVDPARLKIEFTQHAGDEMWHPQLGGFNRDWEDGT